MQINPYTVILAVPDYAGEPVEGPAGFFTAHVYAPNWAKAGRKAQDEALAQSGADPETCCPEDWYLVAIFPGTIRSYI